MLCVLQRTIDRRVVPPNDALSPVSSLLQVPCASAPEVHNREGIDDSSFDHNEK